jgi:hypothetical protein
MSRVNRRSSGSDDAYLAAKANNQAASAANVHPAANANNQAASAVDVDRAANAAEVQFDALPSRLHDNSLSDYSNPRYCLISLTKRVSFRKQRRTTMLDE